MDAKRACMERKRWVTYYGEVLTMALTWCGETRVVEGEPPEEMTTDEMLNKACRACVREKLNELASREE